MALTFAQTIPPALRQRILNFLEHKATGRVVLTVERGRVVEVSTEEPERSVREYARPTMPRSES